MMSIEILRTSNEAWGFFRHDRPTAIGKATGCAPEAIRDSLDSRHRRHFADDVANGLSAGLSLPAAIDAAIERWMGWTIGKRIEREHGIPRDLPYLAGWVMNCEIEAEMADGRDTPILLAPTASAVGARGGSRRRIAWRRCKEATDDHRLSLQPRPAGPNFERAGERAPQSQHQAQRH